MSYHVKGGGAASTAAVAYIEYTFGSNVTSGNVIIAMPAVYLNNWTGTPVVKQSGTCTVGSWVEDAKVNIGSSGTCGVYRVPVTGNGTCTIRFTPISSQWCGIACAEATGLDASPYNANNSSNATSTSETTGSISLSQSGIAYGIAAETAEVNFTRSSKSHATLFEENRASTYFNFLAMYADNISSSVTLSCTLSTSMEWHSVGVTYKGAATGVTVTPAALSSTTGKVDPTVVLGSTSATPAALSAAGSHVNPTVILGSIAITPTMQAMGSAKVDPTVVCGSIAISPAILSAAASKIDPTVFLNSTSMTPAALQMAASKVDPTVNLGGLMVSPAFLSAVLESALGPIIMNSISVTPSVLSSAAGRLDPTVVCGSISISPSILSAVADRVDPNVVIGGGNETVTPAALTVYIHRVNPSVKDGKAGASQISVSLGLSL